ncbi:MAG TPA: Gfo/Idh/MocA family oxidoreductase [Terriglobia bacterium]|nr:Gfo/Idh/MocA family oxidoreductase [Terriglobia bacterium]
MANGLKRRDFLKSGTIFTVSSFVAGGTTTHLLAQAQGEPEKPPSANDHLQIALIGAGGQGQYDTRTAVEVPGVKLVAVADCYNGRLEHAKELWGDDILTTRNYKEILARPDVDAVIIGTPDHWHKQAAVDAMNAGKDVYLEKPMIHLYSDGPEIIAAARKTNRILQVGSQRVSSMIYRKAKDLLQSGAIGQINMISAWWDRNSAVGAFDYSVPPDASPETMDWPRFLGTAPQIPFNPDHFFSWRKWKAYGSGVAGDLFVHLFSGTHFVTGANGPTRALGTGGLRFWKDGRDIPDVLLGLFDYPEGFNLSLHVNFVCGGSESEGFTFTGSEGTLQIGWDGVTVTRVPREKEPGYNIGSWSQAMQKRFLEEYRKRYPIGHPTGEPYGAQERYAAPERYSDSYDHLKNFFAAVRSHQPVVEDPVFGFRAAGAALLTNVSYERGEAVKWDPVAMRLL